MRILDKTMKNYELLLMFNINHEEATNTTVDKYKNLITSKGGSIDRYEDWGAMKLAYNILSLIHILTLPTTPYV